LFRKLFFLLLISFSITTVNAIQNSSPIISTGFQQAPKVAYQDQQLHLLGVEGSGTIEIYSIIGNKIKEIKVQELDNFKTYLDLDSGNMYIIRVRVSNEVHTLKIVTP
jgi:hypothetical protein